VSPRARPALRIATLVVLALLAPLYLYGFYLPSLLSAERPVPAAACRRSLPPLPALGSLTLLIVDGLGFDEAQAPELAWLREQAVSRPLGVPFPSYTTPALLSFATGLGPRDSGVRINGPLGGVTGGLDNLVAVARDGGRPRAIFDAGWKRFGAIFFAGEDLRRGRFAAAAAPLRAPSPGELRILYQGYVDRAGHHHGGDSIAYREARGAAASYLERVVAGLDPGRDRLLVVSDHGHLAGGGHGGAEKEVRRAWLAALGPDLKRGVTLEERPLGDVAATAAVLAGLPTPGCNLGRPMIDLLAVEPSLGARAFAGPFDQAARLVCSLRDDEGCAEVASLGAELAAGRAAALGPAERLLDELRSRRDVAAAAASRKARWLRVAIVGALSLLLAAALAWWPRLGVRGLLTQLSPALLLAVYAAVLTLRGYHLTFSGMPSRAEVVMDTALAAALAAVAGAALCRFAQRRRPRPTGATLALLAGVGVPVALVAAYAGADPKSVPPPIAAVLVLLAAPAWVAAAGAALLLLLPGRSPRFNGAAPPPASPRSRG
jgi:hypothetical protein